MNEHLESLVFALGKYPEKVEIAPVDTLLMDAARKSGKRPAYVKLAVPDEVVKGLRGRSAPPDVLLLVRMPREVADRATSPIVLPGEVR